MSEVLPMLKQSVAVAGQAEVGVNLGPPVLLKGEDLAQYERLLAQVGHRQRGPDLPSCPSLRRA